MYKFCPYCKDNGLGWALIVVVKYRSVTHAQKIKCGHFDFSPLAETQYSSLHHFKTSNTAVLGRLNGRMAAGCRPCVALPRHL